MKINSIPPGDRISSYTKPGPKSRAVEESKTPLAADKLEMSKEARDFVAIFKEAAGQLRQTTAAEEERRDELAEQIERGEYSVAAKDLAAKLLGLDEED